MAKVYLKFPAYYSYLEIISDFTRKLLLSFSFDDREARLFSWAVEEIITNIIRHSYEGREGETLEIEWDVSSGKVMLIFRFEGLPVVIPEEEFNLEKKIREKRKGGLGLEIVRRACDFLEYGREGGKNWWRIGKSSRS